MTKRVFLALALGVLTASAHLAGIYMRMETREVPIERLVANLERELKTNPANVQTLINLARLHAMAYALKIDAFPAAQLKPDQPELPSYPPGASHIPGAVRPAASPEIATQAALHLKEAIRHYAAALALAPDNLTARLGHGWVLQQSGASAQAISRVPPGHRAGLAGRAEDQGADAFAATVHAGGRRVSRPAPRQRARRGGDRRPDSEAVA